MALRVRIGGCWWRVETDVPPATMRRLNEGEPCLGFINRELRTIWVRRGQSRRDLIDTVAHEVTHAVAWELEEARVAEVGRAVGSVLGRLLEEG